MRIIGKRRRLFAIDADRVARVTARGRGRCIRRPSARPPSGAAAYLGGRRRAASARHRRRSRFRAARVGWRCTHGDPRGHAGPVGVDCRSGRAHRLLRARESRRAAAAGEAGLHTEPMGGHTSVGRTHQTAFAAVLVYSLSASCGRIAAGPRGCGAPRHHGSLEEGRIAPHRRGTACHNSDTVGE